MSFRLRLKSAWPVAWIAAVIGTAQAGEVPSPIDNRALLPPIKPDTEVVMEGMSPDWMKSLIMVQFRVETATPEGTFAAATRVLDHLAETGVNGLWINPVFKRLPREVSPHFNGYGNEGPHTIAPELSGTEDPDASFAAAKAFVDAAHERNIRVLFDVITWGVAKQSPLGTEHEDWFLFDGAKREVWAGWAYNWNVPAMREWFINACVQFIELTGADGFRCDLEPHITGYEVFREVRKRLYEKGHKIIIMPEFVNSREGVYDFEQVGVGFEKALRRDAAPPIHESGSYYLENDIIQSIRSGRGVGMGELQEQGKGGTLRYHTFNFACHDTGGARVLGSRLRTGYQAILAPFIPIWHLGEEWNNPYDTAPDKNNVLYFNHIDWAKRDAPENRAFFEDVKRQIRIRRSYPEIFEHFPESQRDANIARVEAVGNDLPAYARFAGGRAVVVVPNKSAEARSFEVRVPLADLGLPNQLIPVTDLLAEKPVAARHENDRLIFQSEVPPDGISMYLLDAKAR